MRALLAFFWVNFFHILNHLWCHLRYYQVIWRHFKKWTLFVTRYTLRRILLKATKGLNQTFERDTKVCYVPIHTYSSKSSSTSPKPSNCAEFVQLEPVQSLQASVHCRQFLRQVQRFVSQFPLHWHLITFNMLSGAGSLSIKTGSYLAFVKFHPQLVGSISWRPCQVWTCRYTRYEWYWAESDVGGKVCTSTLDQLVDTFSWYLRRLRSSRISFVLPPYNKLIPVLRPGVYRLQS